MAPDEDMRRCIVMKVLSLVLRLELSMITILLSKYAIENYEKVKSKTNWWEPAKKQGTKGKNMLWCLYEMLERKDQFFREIPINDAHMATLHYGSKKNLEFEGETYDAPKFTPKQMKKANDARQWVLILFELIRHTTKYAF